MEFDLGAPFTLSFITLTTVQMTAGKTLHYVQVCFDVCNVEVAYILCNLAQYFVAVLIVANREEKNIPKIQY